MDNSVRILERRISPILCLIVSQPEAAVRAARSPGQTLLEEFHITLSRLDDAGLTLENLVSVPAPPEKVFLSQDIKIVDTGTKRSCYVELDHASQEIMKSYVRSCEVAFGLPLLDEDRVFHVTLSNAGQGLVRQSVGDVWKYPYEFSHC